MKNSIFKSYSKRILKSEAFISVIVVFVLALGIIGTSYALYMDVDTDTDYQLVEVGDLKIDFDNIDNSTNPEDYSKITLTNMTPTEDDIGTTQSNNIFSFRIYNTGTYTVDYDIKLVTADGNEVDTKYINFQLCKDDATNCGEIQTLSDIRDSIIREDHISPPKAGEDASVYYFIRIWINNQYPIDTTENTDIVLRVLLEANNANGYLDNKNTLAGKILDDSRIKINNTTPSFTGIATEEGLYKALDDYGTSYYFRGAQSNNYVNFAGFIWRIVRINGDGSIRLILDKSIDSIKNENEDDYAYKNAKLYALSTDGLVSFKSEPYGDNGYIGYMYGNFNTNSTNYNEAHENKNDSAIKTYIDTFYEAYLLSYKDYIADTIFCGDKTRASGYTALGFGTSPTSETYYGAYDRLYKNEKATPTLKCASRDIVSDTGLTEAQLAYSRYTAEQTTITNGTTSVLVNNDLKYPIALLSADELVLAGAYKDTVNTEYYLYTNDNHWWTMTPNAYSAAYGEIYSSRGSSSLINNAGNYNTFGVRPVINLRADLLVSGGDGTKNTSVGGGPYTVSLPN